MASRGKGQTSHVLVKLKYGEMETKVSGRGSNFVVQSGEDHILTVVKFVQVNGAGNSK
jgi:hypothetical protein